MKIHVIGGYFFTTTLSIMDNLLFEKETYSIIGLCLEVHSILGHWFSEIVYKDALMHEANL